MAFDLSNTAEGGTDGVTVTPANSGGASGDAFNVVSIGPDGELTFEDAHPAHGALGYRYNVTGAGAQRCYTAWTLAAVTEIFHTAYLFREAEIGTGGIPFVALYSVVALKAYVRLNLNGTIRVADSLNAPTDGLVPISFGAQNRIELYVLASATVGQLEARLYRGSNFDGATPDEIITSPATRNTGVSWDQVRQGLPELVTLSALNARPFFLDDYNANGAGFPGPPGGEARRHVFGMPQEGFTGV